MKAIRRLLQLIFILANSLCVLLILVYAGAFEEYVTPDAIEQYIVYVPTAFLTVAVALLTALLATDSKIAFASFLIPLLPIIGGLLRGRSKWIYRIFVYPVLASSLLFSFIQHGASTGPIISAAYLAVAVVIDLLP